MGREGNDMETKALKKQLGAAIAMVVVAAIALGSATYAWFATNNTVTAKTSNIYAQSNSAFLVIDTQETTSSSSGITATASETSASVGRYPATWANTFSEVGGSDKAADGNGKYQFESAYAGDRTKAEESTATRFAVGDPDTAATADYAYKNTFYVGTGTYPGTFTNLKVTGFEVSASDGQLPSAMRVLVTCGDRWVVVKSVKTDGQDVFTIESQSDGGSDGIIRAEEFGQLTAGQTDAEVIAYVYYDGSDSNVYTTNINNLTDCKVTLTFEATPTEYGK